MTENGNTPEDTQRAQALTDAMGTYESLVAEANRRCVDLNVRLLESTRRLKNTTQRLTEATEELDALKGAQSSHAATVAKGKGKPS